MANGMTMVTEGTRTMLSDIKPEGRQDSVLFFYICSIVRLDFSQESYTNSLHGRTPSDLSSSHITTLGTKFSIHELWGRMPLERRLCPNQSTNVRKNMCLEKSGPWGHRQTAGLPQVSSWLLRQERVVSWAIWQFTQASATAGGKRRSHGPCANPHRLRLLQMGEGGLILGVSTLWMLQALSVPCRKAGEDFGRDK